MTCVHPHERYGCFFGVVVDKIRCLRKQESTPKILSGLIELVWMWIEICNVATGSVLPVKRNSQINLRKQSPQVIFQRFFFLRREKLRIPTDGATSCVAGTARTIACFARLAETHALVFCHAKRDSYCQNMSVMV